MKTIQTSTVKRAVTSASNIFRRLLCPGSRAQEEPFAEEKVPLADLVLIEKEDDYSREGQMLHKLYMTGSRPTTLRPDQIQALDDADALTNEFFAKFAASMGIPEDASFHDEHEVALVLNDAQGRRIFPGHADIIRNWPAFECCAIADAKFGFMEVDNAADNTQLASYFAMRQQASPSKTTGVVIVQPRNFGPRITSAMYPDASFTSVRDELLRIDAASKKKNAALVPGEKQCHFCNAKVVCPAYKAQIEVAQSIVATTAVNTASDEQLDKLLTACAFAAKVADDVRGEIRARIAVGGMPGFKLQNSGDTVALLDNIGFFNALKQYFNDNQNFTATAYDACRTMQWGDLTRLIQTLTGMSEVKAKDFLKTINAPFVSRIPKAARIVREKQKSLE